MDLEDILRVRIGTILRDANNKRYIVKGINDNKLLGSYYVNNRIMKESEVIIPIFAVPYLIEKQIDTKEIIKYKLLGITFYEEVNYNDSIIRLRDIKNGDCVIYDNSNCGNKGRVIIKENNSYFRYEILRNRYIYGNNERNSLYITRKVELKRVLKYVKGTISDNRQFKYVETKIISTPTKDSINELRNESLRVIYYLVKAIKTLGSNKDLYLIKMYQENRNSLRTKILHFILGRTLLLSENYIVPELEIEGINNIVDETSYNFDKYSSIVNEIVNECYEYIVSNLSINSRKKLSTIARELIEDGKTIEGYDSNIDIEEFFDTDKYYPWKIIDWVNVI